MALSRATRLTVSRFSVLLFLLPVPTPMAAQAVAGPRLELPRLEGGAPVVDGRMDEPVWETGTVLSLSHQLQPLEGAPPSEATEVRILYDGDALYLGARLRERDPARVSIRSAERNSFHRQNQDGFAVILDTNGDQRTAFGFIVSASGARTDIAVLDEARVMWNSDWNAFWDAATHRDDEGWTVEMRIPFSSLRFEPDPDGSVPMGMILWRYLARNDEFVVYPVIPNLWGNSAYKPSAAAPVVFRDLQTSTPVQIKPYVLAGGRQRSLLAPEADRYTRRGDPLGEVGADLKYNVTSNLVLDLTVNTDFAQVEVDDQRFNLERFSLFFPEKRDFFQERSDLFNFRLPGGSDRLFHSRRIGIVEGQPVPIRGGARLTGRVGSWELGLLNMQTALDGLEGREIPGENFGVVRLQRPVLEKGSYLGGLMTSRTDLDGTRNLVYAVDADLHLGGDHFVGLQAAMSSDRAEGSTHEGVMASLVLQRRINRGLSFGHSFGHLSPGFDPGVGFVRRTGTNRWGHRTQYTWFPGEGRTLRTHSLAHRWEFVWDHRFEVLETRGTSLNWDFRFRSGASARAQAEFSRELLETPFRVGGLAVAAGRYDLASGILGFGSDSGADLQLGGSVEGGSYYGGHRLGGTLDLTWNPGPRMALGLENVANRIVLPAGREDILISRLRFGTAWSRTLTTDAFVQYNSGAGALTPNVRLRWNPREGSDLFLVYNEALNTVLLPADPALPRLPRSGFRSAQVKYTYTFVR